MNGRFRNQTNLTTEQIKDIPIRLGKRPLKSEVIGRFIRADEQYVYFEVNEEYLNRIKESNGFDLKAFFEKGE